MGLKKNSQLFSIQTELISIWSIMIVGMDLLHIMTALITLGSFNTHVRTLQSLIGICSFFCAFALNGYLLYFKDYSYLPATLIISFKRVGNGLIGFFPAFFGTSLLCVTLMGTNFHFGSISVAMFTNFYIAFADT